MLLLADDILGVWQYDCLSPRAIPSQGMSTREDFYWCYDWLFRRMFGGVLAICRDEFMKACTQSSLHECMHSCMHSYPLIPANRQNSAETAVCGVLEFKPRLRGSRGHGPKPAEACCPTATTRGHEAESLPSTSMLPLTFTMDRRRWA